MADNCCGVLIFIVFVVDSAVTKITTHENYACAHAHTWWHSLVWPTLPVRVGHTVLDSKCPCWNKQRREACRCWPEEKARFVWIISLLHTWGEGASSRASVNGVQSWLAPCSSPQSESDPALLVRSGGSIDIRGRRMDWKQSYHPRYGVH